MGIFGGMGLMTDKTTFFKRLVDIGLLKQFPVMAGETEGIPLFFQQKRKGAVMNKVAAGTFTGRERLMAMSKI